jgi:lactoylglutathione lyase
MATRWTHITIGVSDTDLSIKFFKEYCGLTVVRDRRKEGGGTVWLGYENSDGQNPVYVLVIAREEKFSLLDHFGFQCDSREEVDNIAAKARNAGVLIHEPKDSGGSVGYWTMIRHPDGHVVEFTFGQPLEGLN